jgi:hypothetical protein
MKQTLHLIKPASPEEAAEQARWEEIGDAINAAFPDFLERVKQEALAPVIMAYETRIRAIEQTLERLSLLQVVQGQQVIIDLLGTLLKERK